MRAAPMAVRQDSLAATEQSIALLKEALEIDPDYISAKGYMCVAHTSALAARWWSKEAASAALPFAYVVLDSQTEDSLAIATCAHHVAYLAHDYERGQAGIERAMRLNPNSATAAMYGGWVKNYVGLPLEAIPLFERVRRLSPLHPQIGLTSCGIGYATMMQGDFEGALAHLEQAITEFPEFATTQIALIGAHWRLGHEAEAQRYADWLRAKVPDMTISRQVAINPHRHRELKGAVVDGMRGTGFPE